MSNTNTMELEIMTIGGIDCYEQDDTVYLNLEAVARGLGFTTTQTINGTEYVNVRWKRVDEYLEEIGFATSGKRPKYIPESVFYRLAMKAKNDVAEKFQTYVAEEVIPSIRKHGAYMTPKTLKEMLDNPAAMIEILQRLQEEQEARKQLETEVAVKTQQLAEAAPKVSYYDIVLQCPDLLPISQIAKDYGMSAQKMNKLLNEAGVQYKQGNIWLLYQKYASEGYTQTRTDVYEDSDGESHAKLRTCWTQKGRLFIYDLLKSKFSILPLIEREDDEDGE